MSERILALAGVFQATELVRQAAMNGTWSGYGATTCLDSLLELEPESVTDAYGGKDKLRIGLEALESILQGENRHVDALRYAVALLQLERQFRRDDEVQERVGRGLAEIGGIGAELPEHERQDEQAAAVARLYQDTISKLTPRIIVNGRPQHLKTDRVANWIRTLLFSGLRSAFLWRQVGGGRLSLLLGRKKLAREVRAQLYG